jgi:Xaa-Pro aminopeptidase
MHTQQRQQAHELLQRHHIHQAVFARPESVKWLTGFAPPVHVGLHLFAASLPLVWYDGGQFTLIIVDGYADLAASFAQENDGRVVTYTGYNLNAPIASGKHLLDAFYSTAKPRHGKIGIEREFVSELIAGQLRGQDIVTIDGWLESLRMIKTEEEIAKLRRNFALCDIGQAAARASVMAGKREIDVWNAAHSAIQATAGCLVPLGNDCVVGRRAFNVGGVPGDWELQPHDSLIVDLSAILGGYWSDSCATYFVGEHTERQKTLLRHVSEALEYGISLVHPGAVAKDIDHKIRKFLTDKGYPTYPHHTGHGVGVSGHEAPRIVPYSEEVLREGMVIMLEPGVYFPGEIGVRLEDALLVTANGAEVLTYHDKS